MRMMSKKYRKYYQRILFVIKCLVRESTLEGFEFFNYTLKSTISRKNPQSSYQLLRFVIYNLQFIITYVIIYIKYKYYTLYIKKYIYNIFYRVIHVTCTPEITFK